MIHFIGVGASLLAVPGLVHGEAWPADAAQGLFIVDGADGADHTEFVEHKESLGADVADAFVLAESFLALALLCLRVDALVDAAGNHALLLLGNIGLAIWASRALPVVQGVAWQADALTVLPLAVGRAGFSLHANPLLFVITSIADALDSIEAGIIAAWVDRDTHLVLLGEALVADARPVLRFAVGGTG